MLILQQKYKNKYKYIISALEIDLGLNIVIIYI